MDDKQNNVLIFRKSKTPNKKRASQKIILRRESKDLKDKPLQEVINEKLKLLDCFRSLQTFNKQVLQDDNIKLKEKNNQLNHQNTKLKTNNANLQKENLRLQKLMVQNKNPAKVGDCNLASFKQLLRQSKKQLIEQISQNAKIKKSIKYTRIAQLQFENKCLKEQTSRLRALLVEDQQVHDAASQKEVLEQSVVKRFNLTINKKTKLPENKPKTQGSPMIEKDSIVIEQLRKIIKQKEIIIQNYKNSQTQILKQKTKSSEKCIQCEKYKQEIAKYKQKQQQQQFKTKGQTQNESLLAQNKICALNAADFSDNNIIVQSQIQSKTQKQPVNEFNNAFRMAPPSVQLYDSLKDYLKYRFQAHHLSPQQLGAYIKQQAPDEMTVDSFAEFCLTEPFCISNRDYLGAIIAYLFYELNNQQIHIKDTDRKPTVEIIERLQSFLGEYHILGAKRQQEMYVQIAELITNYQKHMQTALQSRKSGEGTISKSSLYQFLVQIQLDKEYIQFIITQIILDSVDMDHLNYYSLFQIFTIPAGINNGINNTPNNHSVGVGFGGQSNTSQKVNQLGSRIYNVQPVKQLDEEYEQSQQSQGIKEMQEQRSRKEHRSQERSSSQGQYQKDDQFDQCRSIQEYEPIEDIQ